MILCSPNCTDIKVFFGDDLVLEADLDGENVAVFTEAGSERSESLQVEFVGGVATIEAYPLILNQNNSYKIQIEGFCWFLSFNILTETVEC